MQVDFGVPFRVLERKGEWLHVEHADGEKGWIHQSLIW
jgi:SH3-like domain-containing protein